MAFEKALQDMSIKKRMNYLVSAATMSVIGAAVFVYFAFSSLESQYSELQEKTISGAMNALEIEKDLNYISRTSRDIMLGGDYNKNIDKLEKHIDKIHTVFIELDKSASEPAEQQLIRMRKRAPLPF